MKMSKAKPAIWERQKEPALAVQKTHLIVFASPVQSARDSLSDQYRRDIERDFARSRGVGLLNPALQRADLLHHVPRDGRPLQVLERLIA